MNDGNPPAPAQPLTYGLRDAVCVLQGRGYKIARRWRGTNGGREWYWTMAPPPVDGRRPPARQVSYRRLEDEAERYERLRYRHTSRRR